MMRLFFIDQMWILLCQPISIGHSQFHVRRVTTHCIVTLIKCARARDIPLNNTMEHQELFPGNGPIRFQYFYLYHDNNNYITIKFLGHLLLGKGRRRTSRLPLK